MHAHWFLSYTRKRATFTTLTLVCTLLPWSSSAMERALSEIPAAREIPSIVITSAPQTSLAQLAQSAAAHANSSPTLPGPAAGQELMDAQSQLTQASAQNQQTDMAIIEADIAELQTMADLTLQELQNLEAIEKSIHNTQLLAGIGTLAGSATAVWALLKKFPLTHTPKPKYRSRPSDGNSGIVSNVLHFIKDQFGYTIAIGTGVVGSVVYYKTKEYFVGPLEITYKKQVADLKEKLEAYEHKSKKKQEEHEQDVATRMQNHEQDFACHAQKFEKKMEKQQDTFAKEETEKQQKFEAGLSRRQEEFEKKEQKAFAERDKKFDNQVKYFTGQTEMARRNSCDALETAMRCEKKVGKASSLKNDNAAPSFQVPLQTLDAQAERLLALAQEMPLSPKQKEEILTQLATVKASLQQSRASLQSLAPRNPTGLFARFRSRQNSMPPLYRSDSLGSTTSDANAEYLADAQLAVPPLGLARRRGSLAPGFRRGSLASEGGLSVVPETKEKDSPRRDGSSKDSSPNDSRSSFSPGELHDNSGPSGAGPAEARPSNASAAGASSS